MSHNLSDQPPRRADDRLDENGAEFILEFKRQVRLDPRFKGLREFVAREIEYGEIASAAGPAIDASPYKQIQGRVLKAIFSWQTLSIQRLPGRLRLYTRTQAARLRGLPPQQLYHSAELHL